MDDAGRSAEVLDQQFRFLMKEDVSRGGWTAFLKPVRALAHGNFLPRFGWWLLRRKWMRRILAHYVRYMSPPDPRHVVFYSFSGDVDCNPKYIALELLRRRPDLKLTWILGSFSFSRRKAHLPVGVRAVQLGTVAAFRAAAAAGTWVENSRLFMAGGMPPKREGQHYLNTWHGSLGIKRLDRCGGRTRHVAAGVARAVDAVLTNSMFEDEVFEGSMFPGVNKARIGHPRNDVFFWPEGRKAELRERVRDELGIASDERIALYAPTFRESSFFAGAAGFDFDGWVNALAHRFGGRWRMVVRLHPRDARGLSDGLFSLPNSVVNASDYVDMQELLVAADVGITDYSSWIFDYILGGKPGFIFAPDRARFDNLRGLYYPLEDTPFPVAETEATLCANIVDFDAEKYAYDRKAFLKDKGCVEDGHSSERVVDLIVEFLNRRWPE